MSCSSVDSEEFEPEALVDSGVAHRQDNSEVNTGLEEAHRGWFNSGDYEPTGTTPIRCEPDIPCKGTIESLRAMPMEALLEEFRENHSHESFEVKESKPSLIPRSPLIQLN
ncbi:unnamed protein product [Camellia sinensis]